MQIPIYDNLLYGYPHKKDEPPPPFLETPACLTTLPIFAERAPGWGWRLFLDVSLHLNLGAHPKIGMTQRLQSLMSVLFVESEPRVSLQLMAFRIGCAGLIPGLTAAGLPRSGADNSVPVDSHHHTRRFLNSSAKHRVQHGFFCYSAIRINPPDMVRDPWTSIAHSTVVSARARVSRKSSS